MSYRSMFYGALAGRAAATISFPVKGMAAALILLCATVGCAEEPPQAVVDPFTIAFDPPAFSRLSDDGKGRPAKSVVPTPRAWDAANVTAAFRLAGEVGGLISLPDPVDWFAAHGRSPRTAKCVRDGAWQRTLCQQNRLNVLVQLDPYKERRGDIPGLPGDAANSFSDERVRRAFIADAVLRAKVYRSPLICLGMEINAYYEQRPADFPHFVSLFREARAAIRAENPDAIVFVSFQFEQLLGLFGGQGGMPAHEPHWELLAAFEPDIDAIGISSYPLAQFSPPRFGAAGDLAADYYARLAQHTKRPVVFTELGWPSDPRFGGSPEQQAEFIRRLPELLSQLRVLAVNWYFLHDSTGYGEVFESMGLLDASGEPKPALEAWKSIWR